MIVFSFYQLDKHVTGGLFDSSHNLCTEQSPKESDDNRCCVNTTVLLKMSIIVLETCREV